jgi:hypothetical protein
MQQMVPPQGVHMGGESSVRYAAVHMPYVLPGTERSLTPIYIEHFEGGWQKGVDIYKEWLASWMVMPELPDWAQEPHSWQQIQLNDPEDKEGVNYTEFAKVGATAAKWGVKAIQVTGWHIGGQDQAYPDHSIDPRLGTFEEFAESIKATQALVGAVHRLRWFMLASPVDTCSLRLRTYCWCFRRESRSSCLRSISGRIRQWIGFDMDTLGRKQTEGHCEPMPSKTRAYLHSIAESTMRLERSDQNISPIRGNLDQISRNAITICEII